MTLKKTKNGRKLQIYLVTEFFQDDCHIKTDSKF